jgi:hypothetical protein
LESFATKSSGVSLESWGINCSTDLLKCLFPFFRRTARSRFSGIPDKGGSLSRRRGTTITGMAAPPNRNIHLLLLLLIVSKGLPRKFIRKQPPLMPEYRRITLKNNPGGLIMV